MNFKEHLLTFLPEIEVDSLLQSLNLKNKNSFRLNSLKINRVGELFPNLDFVKHPYVKNGYYFDKEIQPLGKSILFEAGAYYIQEPSAMLAVELLNPQPKDKV